MTSRFSRSLIKKRPHLLRIEKMVVRLLRKHVYINGLSDRRVSMRTDIPRTSVRRLLQFKSDMPLIDYLALCEGLDLDPIGLLNNALKKTKKK